MITWKSAERKHRIDRFGYWGVSDAQDDREVVKDFQELWLKHFESQLAVYPASKWNTLVCCIIVDCGTFGLGPLLDFDVKKSLSGCRLDILRLEAYIDEHFERSDEAEVERVCDAEEQRYIGLLMEAWEAVREHPAVRAVVNQRPIPFRVIPPVESDREPLLETVLR